MKKFQIPKVFINAIKKQAFSSENEIYGWLIGYEKKELPIVLTIFECKKFQQQTLLSAIPDAQEFQEISSVIPQGIGPIGIYHSHPFSSEIFHSHTDDKTLVSLSNQFPNCVSIVTNGKEINYFQMGKKSKRHKIRADYTESKIPKFLLISLDEILEVKIPKNNRKNANIIILNEVRDFFEKSWDYLGFYHRGARINLNKSISNHLVNELSDKSIKIKLPTSLQKEIQIKDKDQDVITDFDCLKLPLKIIFPIYMPEENKSFNEINEKMKTELLGNNILSKIYNSIINYEDQAIIIPEDVYLKFFGLYIKISCYDDKNLNIKEFSQKIYQFISKIVSMIDSLEKLEVSKKIKKQIIDLKTDIIKLSNRFDWQIKIKIG